MANKIYRDDLRGTHYLWPVWVTRFTIGVMLAGLILILSSGCASRPPVVPPATYVDNPLPVYSCPEPPPLTPPALPPWPLLPDNPTEDEIKTWYVEVAKTVRVRSALQSAELDARMTYLDAYRAK
jgi:hypothetical protein